MPADDDHENALQFDPTRRYLPGELTAIAKRQTLARWRHEGKGPPYVKIGARIFYLGSALNEWIEQRTITPDME